MAAAWKQRTDCLWTTCSIAFTYHAGVILDKGEACLIDPGLLPDEIEAIAAFVETHGAVPTTVVITHCHWDHVLGPERLPTVRVVAHGEYVRQVAASQGRRTQRQVEAWEAERKIARAEPFRLPQADVTFDDTLDLRVGDHEWALIHAPGHAPDHLMLFEPKDGVLWVADMLSDLEIPYICQSLVAYRQTLAKLAALDIRLLVPAHGNATENRPEIRERINRNAAYLDELADRVERAVRGGRTPEETVKLCADIAYPHPEKNGLPHRRNVESVFLDLRGKMDERGIGWGGLVDDED